MAIRCYKFGRATSERQQHSLGPVMPAMRMHARQLEVPRLERREMDRHIRIRGPRATPGRGACSDMLDDCSLHAAGVLAFRRRLCGDVKILWRWPRRSSTLIVCLMPTTGRTARMTSVAKCSQCKSRARPFCPWPMRRGSRYMGDWGRSVRKLTLTGVSASSMAQQDRPIGSLSLCVTKSVCDRRPRP